MEKEDLIDDIRSRFPAVEAYAETFGDQTLRRRGGTDWSP